MATLTPKNLDNNIFQDLPSTTKYEVVDYLNDKKFTRIAAVLNFQRDFGKTKAIKLLQEQSVMKDKYSKLDKEVIKDTAKKVRLDFQESNRMLIQNTKRRKYRLLRGKSKLLVVIESPTEPSISISKTSSRRKRISRRFGDCFIISNADRDKFITPFNANLKENHNACKSVCIQSKKELAELIDGNFKQPNKNLLKSKKRNLQRQRSILKGIIDSNNHTFDADAMRSFTARCTRTKSSENEYNSNISFWKTGMELGTERSIRPKKRNARM